MIAPLIPTLSRDLGVSVQRVGLAVPAYMVAYGVATLAYGLASDRFGRRRLMFASLAALVALTAGTATAGSATELIVWRLATGLGAAGVVPLALTEIGASYPFAQRGRPLGWLFAAMAGGMAFGAALGALAAPLIGWRGLFLIVAGLTATIVWPLAIDRSHIGGRDPARHATLAGMLAGFCAILSEPRARRTYAFVAINSIFHSGVFTWLGLYFVRRYELDEVGIALAIAGYGIPGFLFGPWIGRAADRWGRRWILPAGLAVGSIGAAAFIPVTDLVVANLAVVVLSLGYDLTQPLLAGIVTTIGGPARAGQAMGLNVFILFTGFGVGAFIFGALLPFGLTTGLAVFAVGELILAAAGFWLLRGERPMLASPTET
ncbi:MFS transporter [Nitriliruptoraceae bacterium ZYF776]|nr:MFS transporter [Profundirhabdus halotolerans]